MIRTRAAAVAASLATVASLAACSSGGGGGSVSQSQLEAKLKKEPSIAQLTKAGGQKAAVVNKLVDCAAKALIKDANSSQLQQYVDGKISISKVKPKSSGAKDDAKNAVQACEKSAIGSAG
ncbi:hypothetical protein [Jatrophihabitans endophyticus]|uniref:hypothetical protein n=1 Tax=Jatrophihabitans endophyticus TaxID=1206085 RepID=UPI001A105028|nr:hypothetical protein [Jatrophihabitans endophyticus]MBE7188644.1 hypothetical protein [Jatrophihabitans endophyticus]